MSKLICVLASAFLINVFSAKRHVGQNVCYQYSLHIKKQLHSFFTLNF